MLKQIITHPGSAHKDDFLACSVLVHLHEVPILRREPTEEDLNDPGICVVDVGGRHEPELKNFDHHQFPQDEPPVCALSLVLKDLGIYDDAKKFCDWLEPAEWLDCLGPVDTAKKLGAPRAVISQLLSPIDVTMLKRFASETQLTFRCPIWQLMRMVGEDLVAYLRSLRNRLDFIHDRAKWWTIDTRQGAFEALFMPRIEPINGEPSFGLNRYIEEVGKQDEVIALVYPDRRGGGYGLGRFNDNRRMDFTRVGEEEDVHFAHGRGFVAKTSATEPDRLKELLAQAYH
ncbi:MAG: MYG1 family protein [Verrucomicrobiales bacterium]|nr:MYG1 family protein [Verrucomicrobiales bacterium]